MGFAAAIRTGATGETRENFETIATTETHVMNRTEIERKVCHPAEPSSDSTSRLAFSGLFPIGIVPMLAQEIVGPSKGYYLEIPLVLGLTGLVVFAVCRSSRRH